MHTSYSVLYFFVGFWPRMYSFPSVVDFCQVCFYRKLRFFRHNEFILVIIFKFKNWNEWNSVLLTIHKFSIIDNLQDLFWLKRNLVSNNSYMYMHVWNSLPTSFFKNNKTKQNINNKMDDLFMWIHYSLMYWIFLWFWFTCLESNF